MLKPYVNLTKITLSLSEKYIMRPNPAKNRKITRKQLENKLFLSQARQLHVLHFASLDIGKCSVDHLAGSEVILQLTFNDINATEVIPPTSIIGGLSQNTIECIKADMLRSYNEQNIFKPTINKEK
jgi:hypothetical protein